MPHEALLVGETGAAYILRPACGEKVAGRPDEGRARQTVEIPRRMDLRVKPEDDGGAGSGERWPDAPHPSGVAMAAPISALASSLSQAAGPFMAEIRQPLSSISSVTGRPKASPSFFSVLNTPIEASR